MTTAEPQPPKATADDIFAAVNALVAAIEALESWATDAGTEPEAEASEETSSEADLQEFATDEE